MKTQPGYFLHGVEFSLEAIHFSCFLTASFW